MVEKNGSTTASSYRKELDKVDLKGIMSEAVLSHYRHRSKQARSRWREEVDEEKNGLENIEKMGKSASRGQHRTKEGGSKTGEEARSSLKER